MSAINPEDQPFVPPRYTIDLSLAPRQRYKSLAAEYKTQLNALTSLFDQLLLDLTLPSSWLPAVNRFSKLILRKVHDFEQTQELRGISDETGIPMYLLVAFNVVLDLLMGCTSGAAKTLEPSQPRTQAKMLHFRTLDWTMDPLRRIIVQLDFIRSKSSTASRVLASSITYIGFTGVLTGVKQGLSMSLNFRALHNAKTRSAHFKFYFHHLLVLLGRRPSIASMLRHYLVGAQTTATDNTPDLATVALNLPSRHTTAAYIILSDGKTTMTMEKDYETAKIRQSSSFIVITNHDKEVQDQNSHPTPVVDPAKGAALRQSAGLQEIIEESTDRLKCIQTKWDDRLRRSRGSKVENIHVTKRQLISWLCDWPTTNECTHYAAILDPSAGEVAWSRAYPQPLDHTGVATASRNLAGK